jgi:quinol monooxygenase YgiN
MYGTIARLRVKPGKEEELRRLGQEMSPQIPGLVFEHVYRTDADANELYLVVAFASEQAYCANAGSPEQHQRYEQLRALLDADPEWHDGEIIDSYPGDLD